MCVTSTRLINIAMLLHKVASSCAEGNKVSAIAIGLGLHVARTVGDKQLKSILLRTAQQ